MSGFRLLACLAHPDDEALPMGGALAIHASRGVEVRLVTATLGEEGEIRRPGAATSDTLGEIRSAELACAVRALGLAGHQTWRYRDSGMAGSSSNANPSAFINVPPEEIVEQLVAEIRRFRPQVALTFEPGGLYGYPDHIAISRHTTEAFQRSPDPESFLHQLVDGTSPHTPARLFYSARPAGFRMKWALSLRAAGIDSPLPAPDRAQQGTPADEIHMEMNLGEHLETKMASILCHRTQVAADWPYHRVPRGVSADILG